MVIGVCSPWCARAEFEPTDRGCPDLEGNLIRNGSFEEPARGGVEFWVVPDGDRIGHWLVSGDAVDHIATHWEAADGNQSLDLNSCGPASVSQRVATKAGEDYQLCFAVAGNPDGPPLRKQVEVIWERTVVATVEFEKQSATRERMGYKYYRFVVRATKSSAVLSFHSLTPGCYGPVIDQVTLYRLSNSVVMR